MSVRLVAVAVSMARSSGFRSIELYVGCSVWRSTVGSALNVCIKENPQVLCKLEGCWSPVGGGVGVFGISLYRVRHQEQEAHGSWLGTTLWRMRSVPALTVLYRNLSGSLCWSPSISMASTEQSPSSTLHSRTVSTGVHPGSWDVRAPLGSGQSCPCSGGLHIPFGQLGRTEVFWKSL